MSTALHHGRPVEFLGIEVRPARAPDAGRKMGPSGGFPGYGRIREADGTEHVIRLDLIEVAR